jgi:hypothetical protein
MFFSLFFFHMCLSIAEKPQDDGFQRGVILFFDF